MNSLEFINKEIEELKDKLKYFTSEPHTHFVSNYITYCEEKLEMFQQIKTELEVWEVIKTFLTNIGNEYVLSIDSYYNKQEYERLKKALEVK